MNKTSIFNDVINQFEFDKQYEEYMRQCQTIYQLKIYRVHTLSRTQALQYYLFLKQKYNKGIYTILPTSWYQNQRRLYIWYLVCFIKLNGTNILQTEKTWFSLSKTFFEKDIKLLKFQYMNILRRSNRVYWNQDQDDILRQGYIKYGQSQWNQIAKYLYFSGVSKQFKSPKNCRERWNNHLNQKIKKQPWIDQQDYQLLQLVKQIGRKWSYIAKNMDGKRTQHQIKNRYKSLILHAEKYSTDEQTLNQLIQKYKNTLTQNSKFNFFNNIIIVKQTQNNILGTISLKKQEKNTIQYSSKEKETVNLIDKITFQNIRSLSNSHSFHNHSIQIQKQKQNSSPSQVSKLFQKFEKQKQQKQKKQFITTGGINIIYAGNDRNLGSSFTNPLSFFERQFFRQNSQYGVMSIDKSIVHSPGYQIFEQNCNSPFSQKCSDFKFLVDSRIYGQKSQNFQISQSMQYLKAAKLDISQDMNMKFLFNSNPDIFNLNNDSIVQDKQI